MIPTKSIHYVTKEFNKNTAKLYFKTLSSENGGFGVFVRNFSSHKL